MAKDKAAEKAAQEILTSVWKEETKPEKVPFQENRALAVVLTVIAILLGLCIGCRRSVAAQERKIEQKFSTGVQYEGYSIHGDLQDRMEYAGQLAKIGQRYDFSAEAGAVSDAAAELYAAKSTHESYVRNLALTDAVDTLNGKLVNADLSEQDARYRLEAYRNFVSCNDTISHEAVEYNKLVYEFNDKIYSAFPTGTIARMTGVKKLEAFE